MASQQKSNFRSGSETLNEKSFPQMVVSQNNPYIIPTKDPDSPYIIPIYPLGSLGYPLFEKLPNIGTPKPKSEEGGDGCEEINKGVSQKGGTLGTPGDI